MTFKDLNLADDILKAIEELGYETPTPIQQQAIPKILEGCDLRCSAQTGTGKTAAFILPALNKMLTPSTVPGKGPRILILVPTRELALQVATQAEKYSKYLSRMKTVCIYGGSPYPQQNKELSRHYEILVATPGRLIDHLERGRIDFSRIEMLVLDEADRMLDMGFIDPVKEIARATPETRQTLLFSATMKGSVLNLSRELLKKPLEISIEPSPERHDSIQQSVFIVDNAKHKHLLLDHLLGDEEINQAIIFTSTKSYADQLVETLQDQGHDAAALHGNMSQRQRTKTITHLRNGKIKFLVATDVAARGIDILTISHVINFDLPMTVEDYVHRIGRTGRAGATGIAITFVTNREKFFINKIEKYTGHNIAPNVIPGLEPKSRSDSKSGNERDNRGRSRRNQSSNNDRFGRDFAKRGPRRDESQSESPSRENSRRSFQKNEDAEVVRENRPQAAQEDNQNHHKKDENSFPRKRTFQKTSDSRGRSSFDQPRYPKKYPNQERSYQNRDANPRKRTYTEVEPRYSRRDSSRENIDTQPHQRNFQEKDGNQSETPRRRNQSAFGPKRFDSREESGNKSQRGSKPPFNSRSDKVKKSFGKKPSNKRSKPQTQN